MVALQTFNVSWLSSSVCSLKEACQYVVYMIDFKIMENYLPKVKTVDRFLNYAFAWNISCLPTACIQVHQLAKSQLWLSKQKSFSLKSRPQFSLAFYKQSAVNSAYRNLVDLELKGD